MSKPFVHHEAASDSPIYLQYSQLFDSLNYDVNQNLLGKVLTIVDSSISDQTQRKAMKDLIRESFSTVWVNSIRDTVAWRFQLLGDHYSDSFHTADHVKGEMLSSASKAFSVPVSKA